MPNRRDILGYFVKHFILICVSKPIRWTINFYEEYIPYVDGEEFFLLCLYD